MNVPKSFPNCLITKLRLFPLWLYDKSQSWIEETQTRNVNRCGNTTRVLGRAQISLGDVQPSAEAVSTWSTVDEGNMLNWAVSGTCSLFILRELVLSALYTLSKLAFLSSLLSCIPCPPLIVGCCCFFSHKGDSESIAKSNESSLQQD